MKNPWDKLPDAMKAKAVEDCARELKVHDLVREAQKNRHALSPKKLLVL
jgi:hypothetical protein